MATLKDADETVKGPPIEINQDTAKSSVDIATRSSPSPPAPVLRSGRYGPGEVCVCKCGTHAVAGIINVYYAKCVRFFASEEKEEESTPPLPPLLEGIPARSVAPSELVSENTWQ